VTSETQLKIKKLAAKLRRKHTKVHVAAFGGKKKNLNMAELLSPHPE